MSNISTIEQYRAAMDNAKQLTAAMRFEFANLPTSEDKFKFVLEHGDDFLTSETFYCPHLTLKSGEEVSLYDDLCWEKHETQSLSDFYGELYDSKTGEYLHGDQLIEALLKDPAGFLNQDTPEAAVIRDMLERGIKSGEYNW